MLSLFSLLLWLYFCFCFGIKPFYGVASRQSKGWEDDEIGCFFSWLGSIPASQDSKGPLYFSILDNKQPCAYQVPLTLHAEASQHLPLPLTHLHEIKDSVPSCQKPTFSTPSSAPRTVWSLPFPAYTFAIASSPISLPPISFSHRLKSKLRHRRLFPLRFQSFSRSFKDKAYSVPSSELNPLSLLLQYSVMPFHV